MAIKHRIVDARGERMSVERDGQEAARAYLYVMSNDLHEHPFGLLEDVYVEEPYRKQGLGSELVTYVIARARELGCYKLIATSRYERDYVHGIYEGLGFEKWGYEFRMNFPRDGDGSV